MVIVIVYQVFKFKMNKKNKLKLKELKMKKNPKIPLITVDGNPNLMVPHAILDTSSLTSASKIYSQSDRFHHFSHCLPGSSWRQLSPGATALNGPWYCLCPES